MRSILQSFLVLYENVLGSQLFVPRTEAFTSASAYDPRGSAYDCIHQNQILPFHVLDPLTLDDFCQETCLPTHDLHILSTNNVVCFPAV